MGKKERYFVPDLSPEAHAELRSARPRVVFVAESPHVNEIAPEKTQERRPLCGMAGRKWWSTLSEVLENSPNADVGLEHLVSFCRKHRIAVVNAVQFPLDSKIAEKVPGADPRLTVGFDKGPGERSFKKLKTSEAVTNALAELRRRLEAPEVRDAAIHPLGNDADWFLKLALGPAEYARRVGARIAHPSAWWRRGGSLGREARKQLDALF